jgi:hypothetical protein
MPFSQHSVKQNIPMKAAWIAAGVSGALVSLTLLSVVVLVCWRRARASPRDASIQASGEAGEQNSGSVATDNGFAVSYNVTPPLPPVEEDEDSEGEEDAAQHWSNGVVLVPESHPVRI